MNYESGCAGMTGCVGSSQDFLRNHSIEDLLERDYIRQHGYTMRNKQRFRDR